MAALAGLIPVTQKAPNVCVYCRVRKQACDRIVPNCSRCAAYVVGLVMNTERSLTYGNSKNLPCDYTPSPSLPVPATEPLVLKSGSSAPRLSSRGAWELVRSVNASPSTTPGQIAKAKLSSYVAEVFSLANIDIISVLHDFGPSVRHWSPTMHEHALSQGADVVIAKHPLLALGAWLVTSCPHENPPRSELYGALKQVVATLQSRGEAAMEMLQLGLSLAVYEVGHGMTTQAFQTLSGCKAMLILLEREVPNSGDEQAQETIDWLKASLLMLDRYVTCPRQHGICLTN